MKYRILVGSLIFFIFMIINFFGFKTLKFFILSIILLTNYELLMLLKILNKKYDFLFKILILFFLLFIYFLNNLLFLKISIFMFIILFFCLFILKIIRLKDLLIVSFIQILIILSFNAILRLEKFGILSFLYIIIIAYTNDIFAYFGGKIFGKYKLASNISPNKTIEGSIIGYLASIFFSIIYSFLFLLKIFSFKVIFLSILIVPIFSQIGDLIFSFLKRQYNIKNFSNFIPGHGGIIDRIDSVILSFIAFDIILYFFL